MFNTKSLLLIALLGSAAIGDNAESRGRKFACPLPNGVKCMNVEDVYSATNNANSLTSDAVNSMQVSAPIPPLPPVPVVGQPVITPVRCCDPVKTNVTVVGDTLAVASPGPGMTGYGQPHTTQVTTVSHIVATPVSTGMVSAPRGNALREQAQVMRIYITPWEDETGDLHLGGYVLTEVEPRRWSVGVRAPSNSDTFRLVTQSSVRETAQEASTSQASATPEDVRTGSEVAATSNN